MNIFIVGVGMGDTKYLTKIAEEKIKNADIIIGAKRVAEPYVNEKKVFFEYETDKIKKILEENKCENAVILFSGDTSFFSGAKKLKEEFPNAEIFAGISCVSYFCAKIGMSYDDMNIVSMHGRNCNIVSEVRENEKTFVLLGENPCDKLCRYGFENAEVYIGENLSYENEKISSGEVSEFTEYESAGLTVMAVYNDYSHTFSITGIPDSYFIRSDVPMTKREIRAGVISRMAVRKNSCVYDIGAGTGSVSVELALHAPYGTVYAVERTEEGCSLIARNAEKFGLNNIEIVHGNAADVIDNLPVPDEVFIGGSGGESEYIFDSILRKNPNVHVVATAVTLETLQDMISLMEKNNMSVLDIVQIAVTQIKKTGRYHMMSANNPVFIIEGRRMQ